VGLPVEEILVGVGTRERCDSVDHGVSDAGMAMLAERLVATARAQGVQLTGPGGLLTGLTKQVLETALQVEMADHLGYDRHDPSGNGSGNSRNGSSTKTIRTEIGEVRVDVPRDRAGTFDPIIALSTSGAWTASTRTSCPAMRKG
jgi:hypothetical protein